MAVQEHGRSHFEGASSISRGVFLMRQGCANKRETICVVKLVVLSSLHIRLACGRFFFPFSVDHQPFPQPLEDSELGHKAWDCVVMLLGIQLTLLIQRRQILGSFSFEGWAGQNMATEYGSMMAVEPEPPELTYSGIVYR